MIYNKKDLLNSLACPHCQHKVKPYLQSTTTNHFPHKPNLHNYPNFKGRFQRQCCYNMNNKSHSNLRVATEVYEKIPRKQLIKSKAKLDPISKKHNTQHCDQKRQEDQFEQSNVKLKIFLQNHDEILRQWKDRETIDKEDFLHKLQRASGKKGKSFSLKKKKSPSKTFKDLTVKKKQPPQLITKEEKSLSFMPFKAEKNLRDRLKTIETDMYKEHLINLLEINDRNQRQHKKNKKRILEQVTQAETKRIQEQKKKLRKIQKNFQNILKQKTQQKYYKQLNSYQNLDLNPQNILKLQGNKEEQPKKINQIDRDETPMPVSHNKTAQNFNPQVYKSTIPIYIQQQLVLDTQLANKHQDNQKTTLKSSKLTNKVVLFKQKIPSLRQPSGQISPQ